MRRNWFYHPVVVFVFSIIALCASLFLSIYWYMKVSTRLDDLARRFDMDPQLVFRAETWVVVLVLSLLVGVILMGIFTIFVYGQKTLHLYRLQNNFISNFTHELKTPVTSLKLYLETFLKHELPRDRQEHYIRYMLNDVERLSTTIGQILSLARVESRRYAGEFVETDLVALLERFRDENAHLFPTADIQVVQPAMPIRYPVNVHLFEMLVMNLLTNAVTYNRNECPRVTVSFDNEGRYVRIVFEDNGIGLARSDLKKIFRKFYQVGTSNDMSARGSGLGLYLVQNIARFHKGRVTAYSPGLDRGAAFTLSLPKLPQHVPDKAGERHEADRTQAHSSHRG